MENNNKLIEELSINIYRSLSRDNDCKVLDKISKELFRDKKFIFDALPKIRKSSHLTFMEYVHDDIKNDKNIGLELIKINPILIQVLSSELKNDDKLILKLTDEYPHVLKHASDNLKNNKNFILKFIDIVEPTYLGICSGYFSRHLQNDKEIALTMVKKYGFTLRDLLSQFKDDEQVVKQAIKGAAGSIEYASNRLKDDKEISLLAIQKNGLLIKFLSERLKGDAHVALEAYLSNKDSIEFISPKLKQELKDQDIIKYLERAALKDTLKDELSDNRESSKRLKI